MERGHERTVNWELVHMHVCDKPLAALYLYLFQFHSLHFYDCHLSPRADGYLLTQSPLRAVEISITILKSRIWFLNPSISVMQSPANYNTTMPATGVWPLATGAAFQRVMACLRVHKCFHSSSHRCTAFSKLGWCVRWSCPWALAREISS